MEDRRQAKRIQTDLRILATNPGLNSHPRITNLSATGAFIATGQPLPNDSSFAFDMQLPDDSEKMTINARVVWTKAVSKATSAGMGVMFTDILDRHQQKLADFVERNA